jgi:hypothetical protein
MRRISLLIALAAVVLPTTAVQAAKPPKTSATLTLLATPTSVTFGKPTTLTGKLAGAKTNAGQTVDIQADTAPFEGSYATVASVVTDANGNFTATNAPVALTRYRARAHTSPPTTSPTADVTVHLRVGIHVSDRTPRRGARVRFSGKVAPAHDGSAVRIQRRTRTGGWVTVATTTLRDAGTEVSTYAKRVKVKRTGTYRVRVLSGDTDHLAGTSRRRTLTVSG